MKYFLQAIKFGEIIYWVLKFKRVNLMLNKVYRDQVYFNQYKITKKSQKQWT